MKLSSAKKMAVELMAEHGIEDWGFEFDRAKVRMGAAHYNARKITLSSALVQRAEESTVRNTVLHEIAHVLSYLRYGPDGKGHGRKWKMVAREIGCSGDRCHTEDTSAGAKYKMSCPGCGVLKAWHRRPKAVQRKCRKCGTSYVSAFA